MKTEIRSLLILSICVIVLSCKSDDIQSNFKLTGKVMTNNEPINNVTVSIDGLQNLTSITDTNGFFEIKNVPTGEQKLKINKQFSNQLGESFSEKNYTINIKANTDLNDLSLPEPVYIKVTEISTFSMSLEWDSSNDTNFREYKLYRHTSPGLDETTGELVFVSTDKSITNFKDEELLANTDYYYRIYILDGLGLLGGSNLTTGKTDNVNLIKNGNFETNGFEFWNFDGFNCGTEYDYEFRTDNGYNSNNSVQIERIIKNGPGVCRINIYQLGQIEPYSVSANQDIELSFYYKLTGGSANFGLSIWAEGYPGGMILINNVGDLTQSNDWIYFSKTFRTSSNYDNDNTYPMYLDLRWELPSLDSKLSIDNFKLIGI